MSRYPRWRARGLAIALGAVTVLAGCRPAPLVGGDPPGPIRLSLFALGDTGVPPRAIVRPLQVQMRVARALEADHLRRPADALVLLGDNFYPDGLRERDLDWRIRENLVRPYCAFVALDGPASSRVADACEPARRGPRATPLYAVLGNHDTNLPQSSRLEREVVPHYVPSWHMPSSAVEVVELLDAELVPSASLILYDAAALAAAGDAGALQRALRDARGPWRILAGHYPINEMPPGPWIRRTLDGVDVPVHLHLAGHEHNLQVGTPTPHLPYLQVVAGSGGETRPVQHELEGARFAAVLPGFARVDLVGSDGEARLVVSLIGLPFAPLAIRDEPRVLARWSVDLRGDVREEPIAGP